MKGSSTPTPTQSMTLDSFVIDDDTLQQQQVAKDAAAKRVAQAEEKRMKRKLQEELDAMASSKEPWYTIDRVEYATWNSVTREWDVDYIGLYKAMYDEFVARYYYSNYLVHPCKFSSALVDKSQANNASTRIYCETCEHPECLAQIKPFYKIKDSGDSDASECCYFCYTNRHDCICRDVPERKVYKKDTKQVVSSSVALQKSWAQSLQNLSVASKRIGNEELEERAKRDVPTFFRALYKWTRDIQAANKKQFAWNTPVDKVLAFYWRNHSGKSYQFIQAFIRKQRSANLSTIFYADVLMEKQLPPLVPAPYFPSIN
jgi:hypothetical protein